MMHLVLKGVSRIGSFGLSVLLTGVANIATVPFVIAHTGSDGWASVAVGQSLGSIIGILTLLGWVQTGPTAVARGSTRERGGYFAESLYVRGLSLPITISGCAIGAYFLGTEQPFATFLSAVAMLAINLGANWFYIGEGNPFGLLRFDAVPKALGIVVGTVAVVQGTGAVGYSALVLAGAVFSAVTSAFDICRRYGFGEFRPIGLSAVAKIIGRQRHGIGTALLSSVYLSAPVLVLQGFVPDAVPAYALGDKIKQQALTAYRPVSQALQGWTPKGNERVVQGRVRKAAQLVILLGGLGCVTFVVAFPLVSGFLGAGRVEAGWALGIPLGLAFGMNIVSLTIGVSCLLPIGLERHITVSAAIGLFVTASSIVPLIALFDGVGTAWSVALGQSCVAGYQVIVLVKNLRSRAVRDIVSR